MISNDVDYKFPSVFSSFESRLYSDDRDRTLHNLQRHVEHQGRLTCSAVVYESRRLSLVSRTGMGESGYIEVPFAGYRINT
jgi:hypothetical protein